MKKQINRLKARLTVRNCEILIGLFMLGKGLWLFRDSHYFIYPPQFQNIENSRYIDIGLIVLGLLLILDDHVHPFG